MESWQWWRWLHLVVAVLILIPGGEVEGGEVTYDGRSLLIDGQRKLLFSGTIHYPRSPPEMWPSLITKAKEGGLDVIETYVFWNIHEPQPGKYYFGGNYDLVGFLKEIQAQGLYACLRIGPYIEAEWNYGGFPFWLRTIPGIVFREDNEPFKQNMQRFVTKIVELMKSEKLYAPQGGPIILSQIENEYQNVEGHFGDKGPPYVKWAANMAVGLETGVPWIMCKQTDAPDPIINTCNSMRCGDLFTGPNSPKKPSMWTENWTSFYQAFGGKPYMRNAKDIAYNVALFIAKNGCFVNYYMYYGGTNYGRTSSSYIMTSYYDQAPLDEYGLLRQPKYGHLTELHNVIKSLAPTLLQGEQKVTSLGEQQQAYTFQDGGKGCVAFLQNSYMHHATVQFQNKPFDMFPMSISILKNCDTEVFNTAKVDTPENNRVTKAIQVFDSAERWQEFRDAIPSIEHTTLKSKTFLEHISTTKDVSDYLWHTLSFENNQPCSNPVLHLESAAHVAHAFVNDAYFGAAHGSSTAPSFTMDAPIALKDGTNKLSILGAMVGLPASGPFLESRVAGLTEAGIQCNGQESYKFTDYEWGYQVGLAGEKSQIYNGEKSAGVAWSNKIATNESLAWYKTVFDAPTGDDPIALDLSSMGKGHAWVNGQSIGRYWVSILDPRGIPSQTIYHVPRSFLKPSGNILVLFEEAGGNPLKVALNSVSVA